MVVEQPHGTYTCTYHGTSSTYCYHWYHGTYSSTYTHTCGLYNVVGGNGHLSCISLSVSLSLSRDRLVSFVLKERRQVVVVPYFHPSVDSITSPSPAACRQSVDKHTHTDTHKQTHTNKHTQTYACTHFISNIRQQGRAAQSTTLRPRHTHTHKYTHSQHTHANTRTRTRTRTHSQAH